MSEGLKAGMAVLIAIVGVAFLAVFVSKNADTSNVIGSLGTAFGGAIQAAVAPVTASSPGVFGAAAH